MVEEEEIPDQIKDKEKIAAEKIFPFPTRSYVKNPFSSKEDADDNEDCKNTYSEVLDRKKIFPLHFKETNSSELAALLIHEDWYETLKPLYDYFVTISGTVSVAGVPENVKLIVEGLTQFVPEYGMQGWIFTISVLGALKLAASRALEVGRFKYEQSVIYTPRMPGEIGYGGDLRLVSDLDL
ncbi:hypothetical protein [Halostagnicola sp. A-GB9-2]|uniref:hypothetical protein n=1 Tax=Halostagnicola sp. A-GB9-2 TaxID=3048066 RepID=UPI0024C0117C|nr:hypothetical protein [Halostagnicola sp. A-GB9-2]MDJ1431161.1 hypothetical protein [Halostagnicola sp. A-GB9-2]